VGKQDDGFHGEQLHREDLMKLSPGNLIRVYLISESHRYELRNGGVVIGKSNAFGSEFWDVLELGVGKIFYIPVNSIGEKYEIEVV
jgi:hypothetical protein